MTATGCALVIAVIAAALLGSASVAQRRAATSVPARGTGDPRLVAALARRPWWWIGTLASLGGLGLQVLALALGPIILVQSTMSSSIVWTTTVEWASGGCRPTARSWVGMVLTSAGLATVLLALRPSPGPVTATPSAIATLLGAGGCAATLIAIAVWARRAAPASRALWVAAATGVGYGVTAVALKAVGLQLASGWSAPLGHPAVYIALLLGPFSILLSQNALQQGRHVTAVVSLILVLDPVVGVAAGIPWFGERISSEPFALAVAALGALVAVGGIVVVASASYRAARLPRRHDPRNQ